MHDEFLALTKALNVPLLSEDDITALNRLQKQWEHWTNRERQHAPSRVATEQQAAFETFLDNPTAENEQRLVVLADTNLTGTRYAMLRRACAALRGRISAQAAEIVRPVLNRALGALNAEHTRRRESAEPVQRTAPRVTVAAILAWTRLVRSWRCPTSVASFCAPPSQLPRHAPPSLSLGSLGD